MYSEQYIANVQEIIKSAWDNQKEIFTSAATAICNALESKNSVFIFGCSHAGILAEEVFYRTGGLAVINPIFHPGFMLNTRPITMTSQFERLDGIGTTLIKENHLKSGDVLILHSVSGRNNVPIEMALFAKELGVFTIAITNVAYSTSVSSRHPSGKRLYEVCDLVLDNKGSVGDASVSLEGLPEKIGPTSTVVGAAMINALVIETVGQMLHDGITPPVFLSANLDGGDAHNRKIFEDYSDQIFYQ